MFALAFGLMVLLLITRIRAITQRRHSDALVAFWRRIFTGAAPNRAAKVGRRDIFRVLSLWNDFQRVRGDGQGISEVMLAEVARVQGFDDLAMRMLLRGDAGDRIVALTYCGYRRLATALGRIKLLTQDPFGEVALAAFRAAVLIDSAEVKNFVFEIARHDDWRLRTIEQIFKELGPQRIARAMAIAAEDATDEQALRLLRFFTLCEPAVARSAMREQLSFRDDPEVLAAALRALAPFVLPPDRPLIHRFLGHPASFVRIAAIGAIAPICAEEDRDVLMRLLGDANSWVRYRAAQTLLDSFASDEDVGDLRREVVDRYAQDALSQVLAERSVIALRQFVDEEVPATLEPTSRQGVERRPMDAMRVEA